MRQLGCSFALLVLAAAPSFAGSVLFATAASQQRIDAFCLEPDGRLAATPNGKSFPTSSPEPRRLLVAEGVITAPATPEASRDVLYVALADRVQAFRISSRGWLDPIASTRAQEFMDPRDLALSPGRNRLYVAQHGFNRIVAYTIDTDGSLIEPREPDDPDQLAACAIGRGDSKYVSLAIGRNPSSPAGAFLYASSEQNGRIDIYPLDGNGDILKVETDDENVPVLDPPTVECPGEKPCGRPKLTTEVSSCKQAGERPPVTQPLSSRRGLGQPKSIVLDGEILYVEERFRKRIAAFRLKDGLFCDSEAQCPGFDTMGSERCKEKQAKRFANGKPTRQCAASRTHVVVQYENLLQFRETLLGTQFFKGRIDGYLLKPESTKGPLPERPAVISEVDLRMTPVRAIARSLGAIRGECSDTDPARPCDCDPEDRCGVFYVAAGSLDRVIAYYLGERGKPHSTPFSRTEEQKGSFPNDVAVAVLPDACRQ